MKAAELKMKGKKQCPDCKKIMDDRRSLFPPRKNGACFMCSSIKRHDKATVKQAIEYLTKRGV